MRIHCGTFAAVSIREAGSTEPPMGPPGAAKCAFPDAHSAPARVVLLRIFAMLPFAARGPGRALIHIRQLKKEEP
jgi:hypothetical protein